MSPGAVCRLTVFVVTISGLFAFASTTLVLSLYNAHARHVTTPNVVVGMALFYGGLAQFLAGMWEFATGNTFGATGESSLSTFVMGRVLQVLIPLTTT
jgi:succinate-acetate transporter protein